MSVIDPVDECKDSMVDGDGADLDEECDIGLGEEGLSIDVSESRIVKLEHAQKVVKATSLLLYM